jgi:hypothetical protein
MAENKADKAITGMESEMKKLGHLMGVKAGIGTQRREKGGWR